MANTPKKRSVVVLGCMQTVSGASAGFIEICLMHPLDLIKTRFQIQRGVDDPTRYSSILDCVRKIYKTEGFLSFYKGILPPILAETPKRAVKFVTFEQYKNLLMHLAGSATAGPEVLLLAGLGSGLTEAVVVNPFEVVKVRLQAERHNFSQQKGSFAVAREIYNVGGFGSQGLNKALTSTLCRNGVFNMVYFGFYHNFKEIIPKSQDNTLEFLRRCALGFTGGVLGSVTNIPFDVAKSRIQGPQPVPGQVKYKTCFATIATVYREEGYFALYKGLVPKVLRLGPGGAIMMVVFETVYEKLQQMF